MTMVAGTEGYRDHAQRFIEACQHLNFSEVCKDYLPFLPERTARILDVGSGAGQNAAALAEMGFSVTAVEPIGAFRRAAQRTYEGYAVQWLDGDLPELACLNESAEEFDFVLAEGVWHHLNDAERVDTAARISDILKPDGKCAMSLRNGPPGVGSCVYPVDPVSTIDLFEGCGFQCVFNRENINSALPGKENVTWSRVVFKKL